MLRGTHEGLRFAIFDYRLGEHALAAWMVLLPEPSPEFSKWASSTGLSWRSPLNRLDVDERGLIGSGSLFRSKKPDQILRPVERLAETIRRYERETATQS